MLNINEYAKVELDWQQRAEALHHYVMESGRLIVIEVDRDGYIIETNITFRSRFTGFIDVKGQPLSQFLTSGGEQPDVEPGLHLHHPVARVFTAVLGGEYYLFHAYPLRDHTLLIGELADMHDNDMVDRMGHLALDMSQLVRHLRKAYYQLASANALNQELARTDELTGMANRRYFMERLQAVMEQAASRHLNLSLLMIDLDLFKRINDVFGHAGGDAVLVAFAQLLRQHIRPFDLPGRVGGEEFCVYLPDTALTSALVVAERLRRHTLALQPVKLGLLAPEHSYTISVSIGVVSMVASDDTYSLLRRADDCLYRAKSQGRNCVVAA